MTAPYYGPRRPAAQTSSHLRTVADYLMQSLAVIVEAVALLRHLARAYPGVPLGVTGISWGGAMAACIGVLCRMPVACVPCMGSTSPAVVVRGAISWQVAWGQLMAERGHTLEEAKATLEGEFRVITLATLIELARVGGWAPAPRIAVLISVSAADDHYVVAAEGQELYAAIAPSCGQSELRWIEGGHVSSFVRSLAAFVPAIAEAFARLPAPAAGPEAAAPR